MNDDIDTLKKRLAAIVGTGQIKSATEMPATGRERNPLEELVDGVHVGGVFVRDIFYPADELHGVFPVGECRGFDSPPAEALFPKEFEGIDDPSKIVFLDTETTGMSDQPTTIAFMVGLGRWSTAGKGGFRVRQLFQGHRGSEAELLERLRAELAGAELVVTYNGRTFDVPLLRNRYWENRSSFVDGENTDPFEDLMHLDLLQPSRTLWNGCYTDCKLITLERELLSFNRVDDIPGFEIPGVYYDYLKRGASQTLADVFTHNEWDIISLAGILWAVSEAAAGKSEETSLGIGLIHAKAKRYEQARAALEATDLTALPLDKRQRALKELLKVQKKCEAWQSALKTTEQLTQATHTADPFPIEEAAKILERKLKDPAGALDVVENALNKGVWAGKDREALEKRVERLTKNLST
jgi:uncharacterized protein YprB with RNaseH-like and TPR domain